MLSKTLLAVGALASIAAAIPMQPQQKRDIVWVTETDDVVVTVPVTVTITVTPGAADPTPTATDAGVHGGAHGNDPHTHHHHHPDQSHKPQITSHLTSTLTVNPVTPTPVASSPTDTPTTPTTTQAPPSTTPAAEPTTTAARPPATTTAATGGSSSGGSAPSNAVTDGEITYYTPGLGSCGHTNSASDMVVAMPTEVMGSYANPNDNPLCGKYITLQYDGKTVQAQIMDTCPTCAPNHVDLSPAVFTQLAPEKQGVVDGVTWWIDN